MTVKPNSVLINDEKSKNERISEVEELIEQSKDVDLLLLPEVWNIGFRALINTDLKARK